MKHLLTAIVCCLAVAGSAQTWNPDADFDNVIGVNDLMALLSVFGSEWTAEYPQDLEYDLAAYYAGEFDYMECLRTCASNSAKVIGVYEFSMFEDSVLANATFVPGSSQGNRLHAWLDDRSANFFYMDYHIAYEWYGFHQLGASHNYLNSSKACVCTGLVPAVE